MEQSTQVAEIAYEVGGFYKVDPARLLMQRNVREAKPDQGLIDSVRDFGVLEPITAVLTGDGELLVRFGSRRTHAAIKAKLVEVPVYVVNIDSLDDESEIRRVISQRDENTHRVGLTLVEDVSVVETLAGLGLNAAQIAKRARLARTMVDQSLAVVASKVAAERFKSTDQMSLEEAMVWAEFDDEPEALAQLEAAGAGRVAHVAQLLRDQRLFAAEEARLLAELAEAGITVVDQASDGTVRALNQINVSVADSTRLVDADHTGCPGHVAVLEAQRFMVGTDGTPIVMPDEPEIDEPEMPEGYDEDLDPDTITPGGRIVIEAYEKSYEAYEEAWDTFHAECNRLRASSRYISLPRVVWACQNWEDHGHIDMWGRTTTKPTSVAESEEDSEASRFEVEAKAEAAKAARRLVIAHNKGWSAATTVRRSWIADWGKGGLKLPKGAAAFLVEALSFDGSVLAEHGGNQLAAEWVGATGGTYSRHDLSPAKSATDERRLMIVLVAVLAGYEAALYDGAWRRDNTMTPVGRYLRFLASCGYVLSDVEEYAITAQTV